MRRTAAVGQPGAVQYGFDCLKGGRLASKLASKPVKNIACAHPAGGLSECALLRRNKSAIAASLWASSSALRAGVLTMSSNDSSNLDNCLCLVVAIAWRQIESARRIAGD